MAASRRPTPAQVQRLVRLPGSARRYRDPRTGRIFSDRQVRAARSGTTHEQDLIERRIYRALEGPRAERRPSRATVTARIEQGLQNNLEQLLQGYLARRADLGKPVTRAQALSARSPFWTALRDLEHGPRTYRRKGAEIKVGPRSKVARALVTLGLRDPQATYRVGESPKPQRLAVGPAIADTFRSRVTGRH